MSLLIVQNVFVTIFSRLIIRNTARPEFGRSKLLARCAAYFTPELIKGYFALFCLIFTNLATAESFTIKPFISGSYQQILQENNNKGFMLVIWSLDCPSCIKDMELLRDLHHSRPALKIVMLSTDEPSANAEIQKLLEKYQLTDLENWVFADDNSQKLRYEIDPSWFSELPRTYFFAADHQREGVSGALKAEDYNNRLSKLRIVG